MGAFFSFTCGHFGTGGGLGAEIGKPASQNIYIGVKDGDRSSNEPLQCLPFYRDGSRNSAADFLVEQAGPGEQHVKPNVVAIPADEIQRDYAWATDRWKAGEIELSIYTPFSGIPDPKIATADELRDALLPGVTAELVIDNSTGTKTKTACFAIGFDTPGIRLIDSGLPGACGFALHDKLGFAAKLVENEPLLAVQRWDIAESLRDPNPIHQLGTCAGFAFEVPPGERRTLRIAIGCYLDGIVTTRIQGRYFYTRCFSSLTDVLNFALADDHFVEHRTVARQKDRELIASGLSAEQQFLIAHGTRSYYGSTQLLDVAGEPFWVVNEGEYCMMNTLDLSIDHVFWELKHNPWVIQNLLDNFIRHYSYVDEIKLDPRDAKRRAPGGISFSHDMGAHNNFSARGTSSYELAHLKGCFSFMTQEQLCNWILLAACYVAKTGDTHWLRQNRHIIDACAASMRARANPQTGLMTHDSDRCEEGWEITTYDSLDESLGQARANTYLAVKCWASWIGLEMMADLVAFEGNGVAGEHARRLNEENYAEKIANHLISSVGTNGVLPAVLEPENPGYQSRILPTIEALIYPFYWLDFLAPKHRTKLQKWMKHPLVAMLSRHTRELLNDPQRRNLFEDNGIKLSSTSDNSWM
ncbi:MAG TPA: glycoside hydrolase family 52 protein, partial [Tepidisphaeraceae bacterium]|nr:glycoside hydrolase family 52 protein [Tepidisphaeraceae bacterium]